MFHRGYGSEVWWEGMLVVLLWVALTALVVWLILSMLNRTRPSSESGEARSQPIQLLEERYARGEIDDEEFQRRRTILQGSPSTS